jgi:hypothetical protein
VEIRHCSIIGARWLEGLPDGASTPKPPQDLGIAFTRALERRLRECPESGTLRRSPAEGLVVALRGVQFQSSGLVSSVVHAVASANVLRGGGEQREAYEIENFVEGRHEYAEVPEILAASGVYSVLQKPKVMAFGGWLRSVDDGTFADEVQDMHGRSAVEVYRAVLRDLASTFESVAIHGSDLCCLHNQAR